MITNITLENFKCFRKVEVNPRLITVFIGPNGTGKSSVLQALALLKQSVGEGGRFNFTGNLVNFGEFDQICPKFDGVEDQLLLGFRGRYEPPELGITSISGEGVVTYEVQPNAGNLNVTKREPAGLPERILAHLKMVPAARGLVRPRYDLGPHKVEDVSLAGGLSQQENQTATTLGYSRSLESRISSLLGRVTGIGLRVDIVPSQDVEVMGLSAVGDVNMVAEGFGSNALILLLLQLTSAVSGATVMIEEPEIHLHPKAQAELASVLVEEAKAENKQLIMTTHSEHILGRLLTLVAENKLDVDELAIYAFEKDEEGVCTAEKLEVAADGRVKGGLKDFFESHLDELNRYVNALQTRE